MHKICLDINQFAMHIFHEPVTALALKSFHAHLDLHRHLQRILWRVSYAGQFNFRLFLFLSL